MEGLQLKGDFEQIRSGRRNAENKAACFERGNADRFKAQRPIWIKKKERRAKAGKLQKEQERGKREEGISIVCMFGRRRNVPANSRNTGNWGEFCTQTYKPGQCPVGAMDGKERIGKRNVLALSTHALLEEGYVVFLAYVGIWCTW